MRPQDIDPFMRFALASGAPDPEMLQKVATLVYLHDGPVTAAALRAEARLSAGRLTAAINLLEQVGAVENLAGGELRQPADAPAPAEAAERAVAAAAAHRRMEQSRVEMMRGYAETSGCRRQYLLGYFGELFDGPCGSCDTCQSGVVEEVEADQRCPYPVNSRVEHQQWGSGIVMRFDGDRIVVLFTDVGYRTLSLTAVEEAGLLRSA